MGVVCLALDALQIGGLFYAPSCTCECGSGSGSRGATLVEAAMVNGKHMYRMWPQMTILYVIASGGFTLIFCGVVLMVGVCTFPPSIEALKELAAEFFRDKYIPFKLFLTLAGVCVLSYIINTYEFACPVTCAEFDTHNVCGAPSPNPVAYFWAALTLSVTLLLAPCIASWRGVRWTVW